MGKQLGFAMAALVGVALLAVEPARAGEAAGASAGQRITVPGRAAQEYELALDEVELDWGRQARVKQQAPGRQVTSVPGAWIVRREHARAIVALEPAADAAALQEKVRDLRAANPGAEAHLVLYAPGRPRSEATRRLLTREVGLLLEAEADLQAVIAGLPVTALRPVPGAPGGYVADATGALAALELAEALAKRPGVKAAYPLLRRQYVKR
jgi:hypothetical protein